MTEYEGHLESNYRKTGKCKAYWIIKSRSLKTIADAYPWLQDECRRQLGLVEKEKREQEALREDYRSLF